MLAAPSDKGNASSSPTTEQANAINREPVGERDPSEEPDSSTRQETAEDGNIDPPVSSSKDNEAEEDDEADNALEKEQADNLRRKRDREGSLEPSLSSQQQGLGTPDAIPSKKNRLQDAVIEEGQTPSSSVAAPSSPNHRATEGEKVGQIRKRVQDLSWKQRKEGDRDGEEEEDDEGVGGSADDPTLPEESSEAKDTQPPFTSSSPKLHTISATKDSDAGSLASSILVDKKPSSPASSASRTQPTFSSFSKSSSPFNTASSMAGPSWLAGNSGSSGAATPPGGGIRPSALGKVGTTSSPSGEDAGVINEKEHFASPPPASTPSGSNKQLGFGAFASNKAFASRSSTPTTSVEKAANGEEDEEVRGTSFDEALKQGSNDVGSAEGYKVSIQQKGLADLRTGEEDEKTLTSARAKLYTMAEDKNWKERGTGTVRCNIAKDSGGGARLVMRSEGVLRLILNINLFKGMKINLEQDKFLRIVALEDGKLVHFAIKFANQMVAGNFYRIVKQNIPVEDGEDRA